MKFLSRSTATPAAATTSPAATTEGSLANVDNDATHDVTGPEKAKKHSLNLKFVLLMNAVFLVVFLVSLDRTIISTAIPKITNDFKSFNDVGWYGSSYLLTCCALQLLFGKLYSLWPLKWVLISSVIIFEVASVVAGAAPNSVAFIIGRAISGIGAAGIFAGVVSVGFQYRTCSQIDGRLLDNHPGPCGSSGQASQITRSHGHVHERCHDYGSFDWWWLHLERDVEMVLLHQSAYWRLGPSRHLLFLEYSRTRGNQAAVEKQIEATGCSGSDPVGTGHSGFGPGAPMGWSNICCESSPCAHSRAYIFICTTNSSLVG